MGANPAPELARAESRMPRWMMGVGMAGAVVLFAMGQVRAASGFAVGAALGIVGYFWLYQSVVGLLDAQTERVPQGVVLKIMLRYVLIFTAIFLFSKTGWLPVLPIFAGLLVPGVGVLIESLRLLGEGSHHTEVV